MNILQNRIDRFKALTGFQEPTSAQLLWLAEGNDCCMGFGRRAGTTFATAAKCVLTAEDTPNSKQSIWTTNHTMSQHIIEKIKRFYYESAPIFDSHAHIFTFSNGSTIKIKNIHEVKNSHGEEYGRISADLSEDAESLDWLTKNKLKFDKPIQISYLEKENDSTAN